MLILCVTMNRLNWISQITDPGQITKDKFHCFEFVNIAILVAYGVVITDPICSHLGAEGHKVTISEKSLTGILSAVIFAPIIEEFIFRNALSGEKKHTWSCILLLFPFFLIHFYFGLILTLTGLAYLGVKHDTISQIMTGKYFNHMFFFSALAFSFSHLLVIDTNSFLSKTLIVAIVFVPLGLYFGYVRKKYGLSYAIITHSAYNILILVSNSILY